MAERFLDAEEEFWKQGMRPAYLEQKIERYRLVLSNGERSRALGKDRPHRRGRATATSSSWTTRPANIPLPKMNVDQEIFQLPVYAVMAQQALAAAGTPCPAETHRPRLLRPRGEEQAEGRGMLCSLTRKRGTTIPSIKTQGKPQERRGIRDDIEAEHGQGPQGDRGHPGRRFCRQNRRTRTNAGIARMR